MHWRGLPISVLRQAPHTMHLWATRKLADEIVAGQVSPREKIAYFVFAQVFYVAIGYAAGYVSDHADWFYVYQAVVIVVVTFIGARKVVSSYPEPIDGEFFEMAYLLSVPLLVKTTLAAWLVIYGGYWLLSVLLPQLPQPETAESARALSYWVGRLWQLFPFLVGVTTAVVFWYRLAHHVAYVVNKGSLRQISIEEESP
jgi:hypothetical protein